MGSVLRIKTVVKTAMGFAMEPAVTKAAVKTTVAKLAMANLLDLSFGARFGYGWCDGMYGRRRQW
ncbi:MAG: hypothetical protein AAGH74_16015 [Pseudomonadota bacterium]